MKWRNPGGWGSAQVEAVHLALATIRVQKLKSFFTLIGVTISVMFLIGIVSIVNGMAHYMENNFAGRLFGGTNVFTLQRRDAFGPQPASERGRVDTRQQVRRPPITIYDIAPVLDVLSPGTLYAVEAGSRGFGSSIGATSAYAPPRGVEAHAVEGNYFEIKRYIIASGRIFSPQEAAAGARVVVIGDEVARHFFPSLDPIGRELRVSGTAYTVVGIIRKQGSLFGNSLDRLAIAPLRSPLGRRLNARGVVSGITVESPTTDEMRENMDAVRQLMRARHHLRPSQADNFGLATSAGALDFLRNLRRIMIFAGTALPAIGLVVGGIVIMNIMLMAVSERTREIGIRKALGATRRDVLSQFLVEAVTLSTTGAVFGIGLGIALAKVVEWKMALPVYVAPWSVIVATVVGIAVGIISGVYPASQASKLDPIEALRQE
jgi:putative ABC transport system permease protein